MSRCNAGALTKKVGEDGAEVILRWDAESHNHIPSLEQNRIFSLVDQHKKHAAENIDINPRTVYSNILGDIAATGGGYLHVKQVINHIIDFFLFFYGPKEYISILYL